MEMTLSITNKSVENLLTLFILRKTEKQRLIKENIQKTPMK